jgi:hypothetical protein
VWAFSKPEGYSCACRAVKTDFRIGAINDDHLMLVESRVALPQGLLAGTRWTGEAPMRNPGSSGDVAFLLFALICSGCFAAVLLSNIEQGGATNSLTILSAGFPVLKSPCAFAFLLIEPVDEA